MTTGFAGRLARLEQYHPTVPVPPLLVAYYGEEAPPALREPSLIIWCHRQGCQEPEHAEVCLEGGQA